MELKVLNDSGAVASTLAVADNVFGRPFNSALVHQVVVAYQANGRLGTRAQLGRSEVAKSRRKPWRQKGTGRARAGRASSPLWRGGGKHFPSSPDENFSHKVNRKMYRGAVRAILSQLAREDRIAVVEDFSVTEPKTKLLAQKIKKLGLDRVMVVTAQDDANLKLAARNLTNLLVVSVNRADPVSLINAPNVLMTRAALDRLQELLV